MSIKKKLIILFAVPIAALALTALVGFRSQSVDAEGIEDAVSSATMSSAINELALAIGAERLPADARADIDQAELEAQTDSALAGLLSAERFTGTSVDGARFADRIDAARGGDTGQWDIALEELLVAEDAQPIDSFDATGATASLSTRSASWGLVLQERAWLEMMSLEPGQTSPGLASDFAVAETMLAASANQTFGDTDVFGDALTSPAQLELNELRALAVEDLANGTTGDLDAATVLATVGSARQAWADAIDAADGTVLDGLVERNDAIVDARSLFLLLAAVAAVLLAALLFVTGRSILRPLDGLIDEADRVANVRLPKVVQHLRSLGASDEIPPLPEIPKYSDDEVGALVDAFNEVQGTAVVLATEQAQSRRNFAEMFVNFGRRNQQLNHRMLAMLSDLEKNEQDPDTLANLYQLDALATRMRRNAESLLVLAGNQTPRQWSKPVTLERAVRSALGEIEAHARVDVAELPDVSLPGAVVADITHLLAELIENATNFSDPESTVELSSYRMREGLMIQIVDHGIGIGVNDLALHNERISTPPRLDEAPSRLLGLFVVGRLADRHDLRVVLDSEQGAGTTANVLIPGDLVIVPEDELDDHDPVSVPSAAVVPPPVREISPRAVQAPAPDVQPPSLPAAPAPTIVAAPPAAVLPAPPPVPVAAGVPTPGAAEALPTRAPQQAWAEMMPEPVAPVVPPAVPSADPPAEDTSGFGSLVAFMGGVNRGLTESDSTDRSAS